MNIQTEYNKLCEIIEKLINKKYTENIFIFEKIENVIGIFNEIKLFTRIIIDNKLTITILPNASWKEIEHNIKIKLNKIKNTKIINCIICFNDVNKYTSCNKCGNHWCILCYVEIFKKGNGIITCPFCRYSFGIYTPNNMIDICVQEIKIKSGL